MLLNGQEFLIIIFSQINFAGSPNVKVLQKLKEIVVSMIQNDLPKIVFQNLDQTQQGRLQEIFPPVLLMKLSWASKYLAKLIRKMPRKLPFDCTCFRKLPPVTDDLSILERPHYVKIYHKVNNVVIITRKLRIFNLQKAFFNIIYGDLVYDFRGEFSSVDLLEQILPFLPNLECFVVLGTEKTLCYDIPKFQKMITAASKLSKLEKLKIMRLNIPAGWEKVLLEQKFGSHLKNVLIYLHQKNLITKNEDDLKTLHETSSFILDVQHHFCIPEPE